MLVLVSVLFGLFLVGVLRSRQQALSVDRLTEKRSEITEAPDRADLSRAGLIGGLVIPIAEEERRS